MGLNRQGRPPAALILIGNTAALLNNSQDLAEETSREIFMLVSSEEINSS